MRTRLNLSSWEDAQDRELEKLRELQAESSMLQQLLEASCMLELSKVATAQPDLVLFVRSTVDVIAQFFPVDGCGLRVRAAGLPEVGACFGGVSDETAARLAAGLLAGDPPAHEGLELLPLLVEGEPMGCLVTTEVSEMIGGGGFLGRVAEHVSLGLAAVAEAERLRRQAAGATAARLASGLDDWRDESLLTELAAAIAVLPNALGARLRLDGPVTGGPIEITAGLADVPPVEIHEAASAGVMVRLETFWDKTPAADNLATVGAVWDDLLRSVERAEERRRLQERAETDELTGVGNRRLAIRALANALRRAEHQGEAVAVLMFDLDLFKRVNDQLGHQVGDEVLKAFSSMLVRDVPEGAIARMGGEEFLVVIPGLDLLAAREAADRLRSAVPVTCRPVLPEGWSQTVSVGVAVYPTNGGFPDALVREADRALYDAKGSGRDSVAVAAAPADDAS